MLHEGVHHHGCISLCSFFYSKSLVSKILFAGRENREK